MAKEHQSDDGSLPDSHIISHSPALLKILLRPSKDTLCDLVLQWLDNLPLCTPHLRSEEDDDDDDEDDDGEGELSVEEIKGIYARMKTTSSVMRKVIVERIVEKDWRRGLNLWQIASLECRCIVDGPVVFKWTVGRLFLKGGSSETEFKLPTFQSSSFIYNLQTIIKPMIKSHCHAYQYKELGLILLRIQLHDPTGNAQSYNVLPPTKRIVFCAFPENAPMIFWNTGVNDPLRAILIDSLAPAMSRPGERYELKSTALTAKSLTTLVHMRSTSRSAHALGAWSLYADNKVDKSPLCMTSDSIAEDSDISVADREGVDDRVASKRRKIAEGRFGTSAIVGDGKGIEKCEVLVKDIFPSLPKEDQMEVEGGDGNMVPFRPSVTIIFEGPHVFAGIRETIENGITDGIAMPGWMTGEDGVNIALVKDGKLQKRPDRWY